MISDRMNVYQKKITSSSSDAPFFKRSEETPKVIVRSPFEQEIIELLAYASTQPQTELNYPRATLTPRVFRSEQDEI